MAIFDSLPDEIQQAQILEWWETQQGRISTAIEDQLPALLDQIDAEIGLMPTSAFARKAKFFNQRIEPIIRAFVRKNYDDLTRDLDEDFRKSVARIETQSVYRDLSGWGYKDMATAGGAAAVTIAPIAALPFLTAGLWTSGSVFLGVTLAPAALIPTAVGAAAAGLAVAAAGPTLRGRARTRLQDSYRKMVFAKVIALVKGDLTDPDDASLRGAIFSDLLTVTKGRLEVFR